MYTPSCIVLPFLNLEVSNHYPEVKGYSFLMTKCAKLIGLINSVIPDVYFI